MRIKWHVFYIMGFSYSLTVYRYYYYYNNLWREMGFFLSLFTFFSYFAFFSNYVSV